MISRWTFLPGAWIHSRSNFSTSSDSFSSSSKALVLAVVLAGPVATALTNDRQWHFAVDFNVMVATWWLRQTKFSTRNSKLTSTSFTPIWIKSTKSLVLYDSKKWLVFNYIYRYSGKELGFTSFTPFYACVVMNWEDLVTVQWLMWCSENVPLFLYVSFMKLVLPCRMFLHILGFTKKVCLSSVQPKNMQLPLGFFTVWLSQCRSSIFSTQYL